MGHALRVVWDTIGTWRGGGSGVMEPSKRTIARVLASGGLFASLIAFGATQGLATTLVNQGNNTLDTNTGLQWLDTNLTLGRSYNNVLANLNNGADVAYGYRFATRNEISQLMTDGGIANPCTTCSDPAALLNLIELLGPTSVISPDPSVPVYVYAYTADPWDGNNQWVAELYYGYFNGHWIYYANPSHGGLSKSFAFNNPGSFLVRDYDATPLPAALPLFAGGLGVIGLLALRRKKRIIYA